MRNEIFSRLTFVLLFCSFLIVISCGPKQNGNDARNPDNHSQLSTISVALPSIETFPEAGRKLLMGYHLIIEPTKDCAGAKGIEKVSPWDQKNLDQKVATNCEYSIGLELGNLASGESKLSVVYFTNWVGPKQGYIFTATKPVMEIKLILKITKEGELAGLGSSGSVVETPGESDLNIEVEVGGNGTIPDQSGAYVCFTQDKALTIKTEKDEGACNSFITAKESAYKDYIETGDYKIPAAAQGGLLERSARLVLFAVNQQRIKQKSNLPLVEYFKQKIPSADMQLWANVEITLSQGIDENGVRRDVSSIVPYPQSGAMTENARVLFDTPDEKHTFAEGSALAGTYSEAELYDLLKRTANIFFIPRNGIIVTAQDLVDGMSYKKLSSSERSKYDPFQDTFFYLYRDGSQKKVVEVLANLRHSSGGSSPYYEISEFGIFFDFADVHISDSSGVSVAALRGHRSWDFSGETLKSNGRKSYNLHPGGYSSRSSAGCATVRNRSSSGSSRDYLVFMTQVQSFAFHSDKVLGDQYDPNSADVKARAALNGIFIRKIVAY